MLSIRQRLKKIFESKNKNKVIKIKLFKSSKSKYILFDKIYIYNHKLIGLPILYNNGIFFLYNGY